MDSTSMMFVRQVFRANRAQPAAARCITLQSGSSCPLQPPAVASHCSQAAAAASASCTRKEKSFFCRSILTNVQLHGNRRTGSHFTQHPQQCATAWQPCHSHSINNSVGASNRSISSNSKSSRAPLLHEPSHHVRITAARSAQQQQPFQDGSDETSEHLQQLQMLRQQNGSTSLSREGLPSISEGQLMALLADVHTISGLEDAVLKYHRHFRYNHVAAAVQKLPTLDLESSINMGQRLNHLTNLLASGLSNVCHLMDPFQAVGCLTALTSTCCLQPLRRDPLMRLLSLLLEDKASRMWKLYHHQLAQCAAAAAAMQDALQGHSQQQGAPPPPPPGDQLPVLATQHSSAGNAESLDSTIALDPGRLSSTQKHSSSSSSSAITVVDANSSSSSSTGSALALQDPLQQFWQALQKVLKPQLACFSADSLALTLLSFAAAGRASDGVVMGVTHAALARAQKLAESPTAVTRMLKALVLTNKGDERLLSVLAGAVQAGAKSRDFFTPSQLSAATSALAHFDVYHESALYAVCSAAAATALHWPQGDVTSLLSSLARFKFRHEGFMRAAAKALAAEGAAPHRHMLLDVGDLVSGLEALLQLGCEEPALEDLLTKTMRRVTTTDNTETRPAALSPSGCIKLLWAAAVLEEEVADVLPLLLGGLQGVAPKSISQYDLRLLYQAHRLLEHRMGGTVGDEAGTAGAGQQVLRDEHHQQQWQQHQGLLQAARQASARHATATSPRGKLVEAVQDSFEDLGLDAPVQGLKVDGGALLPDLACVVSRRRRSSSSNRHDIKLALMCDLAGRFSRNAPHELLGYWRVVGWLLEADGWKVVRFRVHEWQAVMQDRGVHEGSSMAFVFNTLQAQGVPL